MASTEDYFLFVQEQLSFLDGIAYRKMMGEYVIYFGGKVVAGIYDDRLLVKVTDGTKKLLCDAQFVLPYDGARLMLEVDDVESRALMESLFRVLRDEVPDTKRKNDKK